MRALDNRNKRIEGSYSTFIVADIYDVKRPGDDDGDPDVLDKVYDVGICSIDKIPLMLADNFEQKAIMSLDELFCPYKTVLDDASSDLFPKADFTDRKKGTVAGSGNARPEVNCYDHQSGLNYGTCPTFSDKIAGDMEQIFDKEDVKNLRSVAFKAPIMLAGYGYTTEGMPFPSRFDQETKSGEAYDPDDKNKAVDKHHFADRFRERTDLWKAGPLDIRWDEHRLMYVAAPEQFIGYAMCDIPASSGRYAKNHKTFTSGEIELSIGRYEDYHTPSGDLTGGKVYIGHKLLVINRSISMDIPSGALVVASRLNNGEYFPIFADCAPDLEE